MSVLTLKGKPIDWLNPPKATAQVMWSRRDVYGRKVIGSLFAVAALDHLDTLARKQFNTSIRVIQPMNNSGVAASAGTHDEDFCIDWDIPGVDPITTRNFARANGWANWYRYPPAFTPHQHGFPLPPRARGTNDPSGDFRAAGFKVGVYVDGGVSTRGSKVASSQINDYYEGRTGLSGHAFEGAWRPTNIPGTIFNLSAYINRQRKATAVKGENVIANILAHAPLARLGGKAGAELWKTWEASVRGRATANIKAGVTTTFTLDTNKRPGMPRLGAATKRIGGVGIDLIAKRQAVKGAKVKVIKRRKVNLHIDGHDCYGTRLKVTFPNGKVIKYWLVVANLGRGVDEAVFRRSCQRIRKAFGRRAVYNFMEIDEADAPKENKILHEVFADASATINKPRLVQTIVGAKGPRVVGHKVLTASPGMAKVSPLRQLVQVEIGPN